MSIGGCLRERIQFVIDSCHFVSQSYYLNNSNNDCKWLILACFVKFQSPNEGLTLETSAFESLYGGQFTLSTQLIKPNYLATFTCLEKNVWFENLAKCVGKLSDSLS